MSNDLTAYEMVRAGLQRMGAGGSTPGLRRGGLGAQGEKEGHERHHVADNADGERGIRRDAHPISHRHPAYAVTTRPRRQCHLPFRRASATPPRSSTAGRAEISMSTAQSGRPVCWKKRAIFCPR